MSTSSNLYWRQRDRKIFDAVVTDFEKYRKRERWEFQIRAVKFYRFNSEKICIGKLPLVIGKFVLSMHYLITSSRLCTWKIGVAMMSSSIKFEYIYRIVKSFFQSHKLFKFIQSLIIDIIEWSGNQSLFIEWKWKLIKYENKYFYPLD